MTNSKNTKRALLASVLSMMLCAAMLVGTTFAWFTDSVTSGKNTIVAGNLDVELIHTNSYVTDETVDGSTNLFTHADGEAITWEPGAVTYENFTVKNAGSLALKYKLTVNVGAFNTVKDTDKSLLDVLKVAVLEEAFTGDRAAAMELTFDKTLADLTVEGSLAAGAADKTYAIVIYWEPSAADNEYNLNNGKESSDGEPLFVDLSVNLVATQEAVENDGFGSDYDAGVAFPPVTDWYDPDDATATDYSIGTAEELAGLAELVNQGVSFKGKTITLNQSVDLKNSAWTPIGTKAQPFNGSFDGKGNTISNVNPVTTEDGCTGLFGKISGATISNLTVSGGTVTSEQTNTGVIAGEAAGGKLQNVTVDKVTVSGKNAVGGLLGNSFTAAIADCTVKNSTVVGVEYVGGITGTSYSSLNNITVENCTIISTKWKVGGIVGQFNEGNYTFNNLTVKDTVIQAPGGSSFSGSCVGGLVGFSNYGNKTLNNCKVIGCTLQLDPSKTGTLYGAAGMIGQVYGQSGNVFSFNGCEVSGLAVTAADQKVTGVAGYIGNGYWRGYTGVTVNFNDCIADLAEVTASQATDIGAFVGNGKDNTYQFAGENLLTGVISEAIGTKGSNIVITGEDTIQSGSTVEPPDETDVEDPFA